MAKSKADRYGIGMKKFCRAHEEKLARALAEEGPSRELLALHLEKLRWLQHERLVHLIVLVMTVLASLPLAMPRWIWTGFLAACNGCWACTRPRSMPCSAIRDKLLRRLPN